MGAHGEVNREQIEKTYNVIRRYIRRTPVIETEGVDFGLEGARIFLKLESLQYSGSFKTRGAFANMLMREVPACGVVAASGGNHGVAVAYAARTLGKPAKIFVPSVAAAVKVARIRAMGAELVISGERYSDALAASEEWIAQSGAMPVHAYDQPETLCGQGSVGFELEQQCAGLDTLLVAVGGGGLLGGIAAWYAGRVRVIGVEPEAAPTLTRALEAGQPVDAPAGGVAADSLAPRSVGKLMFPIAQKYARGTVLVTDEAILSAQKILWDALRVIAEPGGAAAFAALSSGRYVPEPGERVGLIVCGGNAELATLAAE